MSRIVGLRTNNFDAMRILAAVTVIYGHAHPLAMVPDPVVMGNSVQALAVKIFFVISGFLVARSWQADPNAVRYLAKRSLRIFPGLLFLLLLTIFALGPSLTQLAMKDYFSNMGVWRYLSHNFALYPIYGLADLFSENRYPNAVNGSLWSLPIEFLMYLVFPVVYVISRVDGTNRLLVFFTFALCAVSLYLLRVTPLATQVVFYGSSLSATLDVAPYFFLGSLYGVTRLQRYLHPTVALFLIACAALLQPVRGPSMELLLYGVLPYAVLSLCVDSTPFLRDAGRFGDPSYGIYLYGFVVQQTVYAVGVTGMTPLMNTLISVPIAVALAYASWHLIEKRALRLKPTVVVHRQHANNIPTEIP